MNSKESVNEVSSEKENEVEKPSYSAEMVSHAMGDSSMQEHHEEGAEHGEELPELDEVKPVDFSAFGKKEFVDFIKALSAEHDFKRIDAQLREIKPLMDEIRDKEKQEALQRYKADGGIEEDFEYKGDEYDVVYDAAFKFIRDKKTQHFKHIEDQRAVNLKAKTELLEKLRTLADAEDTEHSMKAFKELQREWKSIGPVPSTLVKNLWANYSALVDRFYDQRSIYFELKELDRKKNLEAKLELCVRAERLAGVARINDAVRELNELHNEFKHIGPVPAEEKEKIWQRFKVASDAVYGRRDVYMGELQKDLHSNLEKKEKVIEELTSFASFTSDRIKEWNQKTQEILEVQKKWEAVGGVPHAKTKELNRKFWSAFKAFFASKNIFFKKLDEERDRNLKIKQEIIQKALALKESEDWEKTANDLKDLQRQWKESGPVPERLREKIFQEFKQACDFFFEHRRTQFEKQDVEQSENLAQKEAICAELEKATSEKSGSFEGLKELQGRFNALGFVPKNSMQSIRTRFNQAVEQYLNSIEGADSEAKGKAILEVQMEALRSDPQGERKIHQKSEALHRQIVKIENDVAVLRNNLEFFGRSKNAEKLKEEFNEKIKDSSEQIKQLKSQLKLLKTVS
jgi:hypothetical protein